MPPDVDLSVVNGRMAVIFRDYFEKDELDDAAVGELEECEATLIRVVPSLTGNDRQYFAMALSIAQWLLEIQKVRRRLELEDGAAVNPSCASRMAAAAVLMSSRSESR